MKNIVIVILLVGLWQEAFTQTNNRSDLRIKEIMQGEDFIGYLPENPHWSEDGKQIYFSWNPHSDTLRSMYGADIATGKIKKLTTEEQTIMPSYYGSYNRDFSRKVYAKYGDIYLLDLQSVETLQITNTIEKEYAPVFTGDGNFIVFQKNGNAYCWSITTGAITQLTNFQSGEATTPPTADTMHLWLKNQQEALFGVLQERKRKEEVRKHRKDLTTPHKPKAIYYGKKGLFSMVVSPDMQFVVYQLTTPAKAVGTIVPDYVTNSGYTKEVPSRPKVGSRQERLETWIFDVKADSTYRVVIKDIPGIYDKPAFLKDYQTGEETWQPQYKDPRPVNVLLPSFADDGKAVVVVRSLDNKDRWIMQLAMTDGHLKLLDRQHDDAWIGGPGISGWNLSSGNIGWLDNDNIWYQSEETGYAHLYRQHVATGKKQALTHGDFEISSAKLSRDKKTFFITCGKESPHDQNFFLLSSRGGKMKKITTRQGGYKVVVSPDEQHLAVLYSTANTPWELYVMPLKQRATMMQLTHSTTKAFNRYKWRFPEIIRFTARDGVKVPARIYRPDKEKNNGAGIIFVHGAGYLHNVHRWWSEYDHEYMFNNLLADNGYTVLDIDYRASAGYGRDWRTAIYRFMGGKDLTDQLDGVQYLVQEEGCDAARIGIYGGSYGGFMTLMAMFTAPGTFRSGAALRSVTDWAHYNHGYTSNILNTPAADSLAYIRSSPIYHAEGLQGRLLILHGMVDTNVHFQDVVRLSQRLIELGKEDWELAVFPTENHGFKESASWADEYRRIYELFDHTLR